MLCVNKCEFQKFDDGKFYCELYEINLITTTAPKQIVIIERCNKCVEEGTIGSNTKQETTRKLKVHLGWLMDFFYSYKDDIEEEVSNIYRLLKELEKGE